MIELYSKGTVAIDLIADQLRFYFVIACLFFMTEDGERIPGIISPLVVVAREENKIIVIFETNERTKTKK